MGTRPIARFGSLMLVLIALAVIGAICACQPSTTAPPGGDGTGEPAQPAVTPASVATRIRNVADSIVRIYPDRPEVVAIARSLSEAAGFVESGNFQGAGQLIVTIASQWPQYREYALLASIALELLSPGPVSGPKALVSRTWTDAAKAAATPSE